MFDGCDHCDVSLATLIGNTIWIRGFLTEQYLLVVRYRWLIILMTTIYNSNSSNNDSNN